MKTLADMIRELREEKDLSLRKLAEKSKVSPPFLSDIELGRRYPSEKVLGRISRALGTSIEDLRSCDSRPPVRDLRRLVKSDSRYGIAFRMVMDQKFSPEELIEFAESKEKSHKKT